MQRPNSHKPSIPSQQASSCTTFFFRTPPRFRFSGTLDVISPSAPAPAGPRFTTTYQDTLQTYLVGFFSMGWLSA